MARLSEPLRRLDEGLVALKAGLGDAWGQSVVLVMTEFGRTVRVNGTKGRITARAPSRLCWAARSRAGGCWQTGRGLSQGNFI